MVQGAVRDLLEEEMRSVRLADGGDRGSRVGQVGWRLLLHDWIECIHILIHTAFVTYIINSRHYICSRLTTTDLSTYFIRSG